MSSIPRPLVRNSACLEAAIGASSSTCRYASVGCRRRPQGLSAIFREATSRYDHSNPHPATIPGKQIVKKSQTATEDIDLSVEVLADGTDATVSFSADTAFDAKSVRWNTPVFSYDGKGLVTSLSGKVEIKGTIQIKTVYKPDAKPTDISGYGRGTTPDDIKAGDTSLGFSMNCVIETTFSPT